MLQFSEAFLIDDNITESKFQKLFKIFVNPEYEEVKILPKIIDKFSIRIQKKLISKVKDKVHTNIKLTKTTIPSLYFNFQLDCIGKNGVITSAKAIDFSLKENALNMQIAHYFQVMMLLIQKYETANAKNNIYLIGDEPSQVESKAHEIWEQIQKQSIFNIIHSEETGVIANKIDETNAHRFLVE